MLQLYSFYSGYSLVVSGKDFFEWGEGERGSNITTKKIPKHSFPFFTTIKLIYILLPIVTDCHEVLRNNTKFNKI